MPSVEEKMKEVREVMKQLEEMIEQRLESDETNLQRHAVILIERMVRIYNFYAETGGEK